MRHFDWTRLAYLLFVLTVLTILVRMGDSGAEALSFATGKPEADERQEAPDVRRWSETDLSSLEDARGEAGGADAPKVVEPRVPTAPATEGAATGRAVRQELPVVGSPDEQGVAGPEGAPPVFYRPPAADAGPSPRASSGPVCGDLGRFPEGSEVVFPLEREYFHSYEDTWGAARPQGGHEGTDLMTPAGVPEYAVTDGTVVPVAGSNDDGWNTLGGYAVMVRADYSVGPVKKGDLFYYAHLERESPLPIGARVRAGQVVGHAGDTGQGPEVTSGLFPPHLHLGWYDGTGGRSDVDSGAMNPYPLLEWIQSNGGAVAGGSDARYCEALGPRPSAGPDWPAQNDPGVRPDIDTGSDDPRPSLAVRKETKKTTEKAGDRAKKPERMKPERRNPERPNRPDKVLKKKPDNERRRPPDANRPNAQKPDKPERPNGKPSKPPRPHPGQKPPDGSAPEPPETSGPDPRPPHGNGPGDPSGAPDGTGDQPPGTKPGGDAGGGDGAPTIGDEAGEDESSPTDEQYDPSAAGQTGGDGRDAGRSPGTTVRRIEPR